MSEYIEAWRMLGHRLYRILWGCRRQEELADFEMRDLFWRRYRGSSS